MRRPRTLPLPPRWSDPDLTKGSVLFTRAHARVRGGVAEKTTKADVEYGIAPYPATIDSLRAHRKRCAERALATGVSLPPDAFVFATRSAPDGSVAWTPAVASGAFSMPHWLSHGTRAWGHGRRPRR
ncbi:MAG TPA: hypothetical protein VGJ41_03120 [Nocardioides sp.]